MVDVVSLIGKRTIAVGVGLALALLGVVGCTPNEPDAGEVTGDVKSQESTDAPHGSRHASGWLWPQCGQKVESPGLDKIKVDVSESGLGPTGGVTVNENGLTFGVVLDNQTDLLAVGVGYTLRFIGDGEDVTDELGDDFKEQWQTGPQKVDLLSSGQTTFGDSSIEKPDGWEDLDLKLDVKVTGVDYWCTYEEPGPYSG